jgi:hypothetical protein
MKKLILSTLLATACTVAAAEPADAPAAEQIDDGRIKQTLMVTRDLQDALSNSESQAFFYSQAVKTMGPVERAARHHLIMHSLSLQQQQTLLMIHDRLLGVELFLLKQQQPEGLGK